MAWTLSEVAKRTGAKPRSLQLWADAGIVRPVEGTDRAGSGVHRRFDPEEVRLIALLVPLANWGVPIGWLLRFGREFRKVLGPGSEEVKKQPGRRKVARALERAIAAEGHNYLVFTHAEKILSFDVVTDEHRPVAIDLPRLEKEWSFMHETSMLGILNLNRALRGLEG